MERLSGQSIALLSYIDPLVAIFISGLILREHFTGLQMIGGIILITSTFLSEFSFKSLILRRKKVYNQQISKRSGKDEDRNYRSR
ncbi:DMT family transporter [Staphylococcus pettenkoferi]|nr:EamA family transporter [Staphylococcus pettenkoferi]MBX8993191.1 EamA family transporter [Staphylococcus pettenkoferi]MCY1589533.1 DMT family transporter [Staphylococcus pettenkoferi]MCY1592441.1 DMT family transporter [Staphylococcus pettenkoferi]MCY1599038.1 DMT family transporter [Staphylococcus pettenkoferi]MCY1602833.1 DMT family transporter [Staphylococcus pettenkoferi]